jgi:transcription-repair coupling factor (superfamily II helicase)
MPDATGALIDSHRLRIEARPLGIAKVDADPDAIVLQFMKNPRMGPQQMIQLSRRARTSIAVGIAAAADRGEARAARATVQRVRSVFDELGEPVAAQAAVR